jgi:hypothetical protein
MVMHVKREALAEKERLMSQECRMSCISACLHSPDSRFLSVIITTALVTAGSETV